MKNITEEIAETVNGVVRVKLLEDDEFECLLAAGWSMSSDGVWSHPFITDDQDVPEITARYIEALCFFVA